MKVSGKCTKVYNREVKGRTYYSVCIEGGDDDGSDLWASCGATKPRCSEGDHVTLIAEKDGKYWKTDAKAIEVTSAKPAKASGGGGGTGWNDPNRQKSIVAQSAFKTAIEFVSLALEAEALPLGAKNAKAATRFDILTKAVDEKASELYWAFLEPDSMYGEEKPDDEEDEFNPIGE